MKTCFTFCFIYLLLFFSRNTYSQSRIKFDRIFYWYSGYGRITGVTQDPRGYIWFISSAGLHQYDGTNVKSYRHNPSELNSLSNDGLECLNIDSVNNILLGTNGGGLDFFDPATNKFTHYRHDPKDSTSLSSDTVFCILKDHSGQIWIGTHNGLNLMDSKTGRFKRFMKQAKDPSSLSHEIVRVLYEDKDNVLWVGCGHPSLTEDDANAGGLNRYDRETGKFTRYLHDPNDRNSLENNKVTALYEDSRGQFWVGTAGDGLHLMDRKKGSFTHYYYDPENPGKLSRPPLWNNKSFYSDHISFIREDNTGALWIGTFWGGINRYDTLTKKVTHFGAIVKGNENIVKDTAEGFKANLSWQAFISRDGLFWITTLGGDLYKVNCSAYTIPYYKVHSKVISFYQEEDGKTLWIGTYHGLIRRNLHTQKDTIFRHNPLKGNSISSDSIMNIKPGGEDKLWISTFGGLNLFDQRNNTFRVFKYDEKNPAGIASNDLRNIVFDDQKNLWIGTLTAGIEKMDGRTGVFSHYKHNPNDSKSLIWNDTHELIFDQNKELWISTHAGIDRLDKNTGQFHHYLQGDLVWNIFVDASGIVWAGSPLGLYRFNKSDNRFEEFINPNTKESIENSFGFLEDDKKNLWIRTVNSVIKINPQRDGLRIYTEKNGVFPINDEYAKLRYNYKTSNGQLIMGEDNGYIAFFPDSINFKQAIPAITFTNFRISNRDVIPQHGSVLSDPVWQTKEIRLAHQQNVFSFDILGFDYTDPGKMSYQVMLENYDNKWRSLGSYNRADFFNVPPGEYIFHARALNSEGASAEKTISVVVLPPWWSTWWAYIIYLVSFILALTAFIRWRTASIRREKILLEQKVALRTQQLKEEKEKVESSLAELKTTQTQLIQSEKMASLGQLTAGIAHEIKNPLNFVNNFSDLNKELVIEMRQELDSGNADKARDLSKEIEENEVKIMYHGQRADAIVNSMLLHSTKSAGKQELTDINTMADECLRLAFHGIRAKDKGFNATLQTDLDESIDKINIIPQEIGRVFLNLYNNAFYAVSERSKLNEPGYEPTVSVSTRKHDDKIVISVQDNGVGIPENVRDKIFEPFFTTKPTGKGAGLGLSLSYDIVKAHGGEIKMLSNEGKGFSTMVSEKTGAEFIIQLPLKTNE